MSHLQQLVYFASLQRRFPRYFEGSRVLEIGSLNINGSIRQFFRGCDYLGVDLGPGPDVDFVCAGQDLRLPEAAFDVTCSTECFEHNPYWRETFANMVRMTRPGGLVCVTCATEGRPEHGTPRTTPADSPFTSAGSDYYRNLGADDFRRALDLGAAFAWHEFRVDRDSHDLYFAGLRPPLPSGLTEAQLHPAPESFPKVVAVG